MKLAMAVVLVASMALPARSQDSCPEVTALNALYEVRAARLHAYSSSYEVGSAIDRQIDYLREPLRDGGYVVEGRPTVIRKTIGAWMGPNTSRTFDLGAIVDSADATIEVAARPDKKKETVAEIIFKEAVAQDDLDNPNYETIQALQRLSGLSDPAAIDYEIGRLERRIFPSLEPAPFTTFLLRIKEAEALIRSSKEEEQDRGKRTALFLSLNSDVTSSCGLG